MPGGGGATSEVAEVNTIGVPSSSQPGCQVQRLVHQRYVRSRVLAHGAKDRPLDA